MPKVLFVATVVREHINVFHVPFLKLFKDKGWETAVAAKNDYFENPESCIIPYCDQYYDIPFERNPLNRRNITAYRKLKELIQTEHYDIIHCHTPVGGMLTRIAAKEARMNGTRVIYTAHGFHFYDGAPLKNWLLYYPVEKFLSRFTDTLITINSQDYRRAKKFKAKEAKLVPGVGIDRGVFSFNGSKKSDIINEFGIDSDTFVISTVGELIKRKNYLTLLSIMEKLKSEKVVCLICGRGVMQDELEKYVKLHNMQDYVKFLGFRSDVARILKGSDLFVFTSFQEGLPVAVMEAMGCGKPIVASNIRGNADLVSDGVNGYLLSPTDVDGYVKKISFLKNNPSVMHLMGMKSSEMIDPFIIENVINEMKEIYFSVSSR